MEIGIINTRQPLKVYLLFERFPVWLFVLEVNWVVDLIIVGYESIDDLLLLFTKGECDMLNILLQPFLKVNRVSFCQRTALHHPDTTCHHDTTLILISGTLFSFLVPTMVLVQGFKTCGVVDAHFCGRLRNRRPTSQDPVDTDLLFSLQKATWHRRRHESTGGPTEFVALFVFTNIAFTPEMSVLQRGIRHLFNAGIKPGPPPKILPVPRDGHYYVMDDRLRPGFYNLPILCSSHFHSSGTGYRVLTIEELGTAHGFPRSLILPSFPAHFLHLPPCQLLISSIQSVWLPIPPSLDPSPPKQPVCSNDIQTYIWLPHSWIDASLITSTASKADDAVTPCRLCDTCLELLFPGCTSKLDVIWDFILRLMRKRLSRESRRYLARTFGTTWSAKLYVALGAQCLGPRMGRLGGEMKTKMFTNINFSKLHSDTRLKTQLFTNNDVDVRELNSDTGLLNEWHFESAFESDTNQEVFVTSKDVSVINETKQNESNQLLSEVEKVREVLSKFCNASWWEWDNGSALFFWRWGEEVRLARDGMNPFVLSELPRNQKKGRSLEKNSNIGKIVEKLATIVKRGYIQPGYVKLLIDFFAVPKGDDIRLVYNGTSCGLNGATWAPNFWLPYPRTAIRLLDYGYYSVDVDFGEMFLNFPLHKSIQSSSGIDLSPFQKELGLGDGDKKMWYCWKRNWMGARMSPYSSVQFCSLAEEFCRGDHKEANNPLRWDVIVLNLPGSKGYDPSKPRVYKWDRTMGAIAGDLVIFVDDVRATAKTVELAWAIARQVCSRVQFLGIQDASRKRKPPTQTPGAWAGAVFATTEDTVTKTVTQDKWEKAKRIVHTLNAKILEGGIEAKLGYKELEVSRGFLWHLSMTYEVLVPFLKGFHLALAGHLTKRDSDGWKLTDKSWAAYLADKEEYKDSGNVESKDFNEFENIQDSSSNPPLFVTVSQHLRDDLQALAVFLEQEIPPIINDRCASIRIVRYGFGEASGTGFGSTIQTQLGLKYRVGVWGSDEESESSNFKELENVVCTIEDEAASGGLDDAALFFFTDNTTVESALFRGNSKSKKLFQLVVRFRKIQLLYGMQVTVSHVSGKRMIEQGTDGFSRGNMKEGVGSGIEMIQFIPLHQSAVERHKPLLEWIRSWAGNTVELLSPSQWFTRGHDHFGGKIDDSGFWRISTKPGVFLWAPPPAAAEAAIEQLRRALIKRQRSTHIIICPRLLTTEWMKQLHKAADLLVYLPAGVDVEAWPGHMFEPLTIAFVFPFLSFKPWKRKGFPKMFDVARELSRLWKGVEVDSRDFLRKFFETQLQLSGMSERVTTPGLLDGSDDNRLQKAWGKRQVAATAFLEARDGDHLMVPFECDTCIFWKLRGTGPNLDNSPKDKLLLSCIRRVNLDAFWSRMTSTVTTNRDKVRAGLKLSESVGLEGPYVGTKAFPVWDHCGYEVAIQMVLASLKPGKYSDVYTQWDTVRKLRTASSNHFRASGQANSEEICLTDDRGHTQRLSKDPCASVWFGRFFMGCKRRMGQDWRPNKAMGVDLILELLIKVVQRMDSSISDKDHELWLTFGAYICSTYVLSLRGVEGLLIDVKGMIDNRHKGGDRFFIIALLGMVKGEHHGRYHLLPCIQITSSKIYVFARMNRLMDAIIDRGFTDGPLISDWSGKVLSSDTLDKMLAEILEELYEEQSKLFLASVTSRDDIAEHYQVYRSLRRSSASRALEQKVKESDIDIVNRWHKVEKAQGNRPAFQMRDHYAQVELLLEPFLRYTFAM